jgi:hypothetical protein
VVGQVCGAALGQPVQYPADGRRYTDGQIERQYLASENLTLTIFVIGSANGEPHSECSYLLEAEPHRMKPISLLYLARYANFRWINNADAKKVRYSSMTYTAHGLNVGK